MVKKTRAVVFDLGKVLIDFSMEKACSQIGDVSGVNSAAVRSFLFDEGHELRFESGAISFDELHHLFEERFKTSVSPQALMTAASDIFEPIRQNLSLVEKLHHGYRDQAPLVLLSNTNEIHWRHIERHWNPSRFFDHVILSFEVKALKPQEAMYHRVGTTTGLSLASCFFVDDVSANIDGARRAGLDAELYTDPGRLQSDLVKRGFLL
jgi:FMN phosphatase YigB (HAD superfamily)